ncbi:MAG: ABC transporter permease [Chitinophagales bacterium]
MQKIWYIIQREYLSRVRKRSFILITLLLPVLVGVFTVAMVKIATSAGEKLEIAVLDESHLFQDKFRGLDVGETLRFDYLLDTTLTYEKLKKSYAKKYDAFLYIPKIDLEKPIGITYYSASELGAITQNRIETAITEEVRKRVLESKNYDVDIIDKLDKDITLNKIINDEKKQGSTDISSLIGYLSGMLIYIFLVVYGAMVMRGVTEEKTNRIIEVLITTVKPFQLMIGKIIGIGAVGLTQFILWAVLTMIVQVGLQLFYGNEIMAMQALNDSHQVAQMSEAKQIAFNLTTALADLDIPRIIFSFIFYFIFGYLFYAAQFAAVGAAVNEDSEVQSFMLPITMPIIISIFLMSITIQQPSSATAVWSSMIPFSSSIIMMARIPFHVAWWQQLLSMFILIVSSFGMIYLAAKIYRIGILTQGKKITFKEIGKWIFY